LESPLSTLTKQQNKQNKTTPHYTKLNYTTLINL
jgi:hypothetical protein